MNFHVVESIALRFHRPQRETQVQAKEILILKSLGLWYKHQSGISIWDTLQQQNKKQKAKKRALQIAMIDYSGVTSIPLMMAMLPLSPCNREGLSIVPRLDP